MYLISVYFDEKTDQCIRMYMKLIAKHTGNAKMLEGNVPPHITIAAFGASSEEEAKDIFLNVSQNISSGTVQWVSIGTFFPGVIYAAPVLNEYLQGLSEIYSNELMKRENLTIEKRYQPFCWFPHTTLGKHLNKEQLISAFSIMQNHFGPFSGKVTKIGLAKTNPYTNLEVINLK